MRKLNTSLAAMSSSSSFASSPSPQPDSVEIFVNAEHAAAMPGTPACFVRLYERMTRNELVVVGEALRDFSDEELDELIALASRCMQDPDAVTVLSLMAIRLCANEGLVVRGSDNVSLLARRLLLMVQAEMLHRQGLVELEHARLTMEAFDPTKLKLTAQGAERFGAVTVRTVPPADKGAGTSQG